MSTSTLGLSRKPSLTQEREKFERDQSEAIGKAVNNVESAVKEKHIRSAIIGTWHEKGASIFWNSLGRMPLPSQVIMSWKAMLLIHKLLREGHPNIIAPPSTLLYNKHSMKGGYGWLIDTYLAVLIAKLEFHQKNESIPGSLRNSDGGPIKYSGTDMNDYFELSVDIFDYLDTLVALEKRIFSTLDPFRASSQRQAVQCRICPFPVIVQECGSLYDIVLDIMYKLHSSLPVDTLTGHRERFYSHFAELKKFFFDAGNMAYVKALVPVPELPKNPPSFSVSDPKPVLARSSSFERPRRRAVPAEDLKRQSLMEPLTVPTTDPLLQSTPQTPESDILGLEIADGPTSEDRNLLIYQLRQEIFQLKLALEKQQNELTEELNEYKAIAEKTCEENVLLRTEIESKDEDKKDQKGSSDEKFNKLKGMYGKLREEHIQLLRTNADVKQKLSGSEREKEELSEANEKLQQEVDDKAAELLQVIQKAELESEQEGKLLTQELEALRKEKAETDESRKAVEENLESTRKDYEEKVSSLVAELGTLKKEKSELEQARSTAEEQMESMTKKHEEKISTLETERLEELSKEKQDLLGMALQEAQKTIQDALDQFANPKHNSTTCTADYLLSRIDGLPQVVDELESKFSSYRQDHKDAFACVRCVSSFSRHLGECILSAKATSHMAPTQEATDPSAIADRVNAVKKHISDITKVAEALVPKEKDNMDSVGGEVEDEINATAELVADSAARIEAIKNLIIKSKVLQKEIVDEGKYRESDCLLFLQPATRLIRLSKVKASLRRSLWHPMKLQQAQFN
ncbi:Huntingtin-interacting protein 1 [Acropora cervicornis]|uniref:Huntingtin-interacting protein 1 n=1 Tax=Acropora cervicornis TaxID=6130 RepID=A0AAD9R6W8_ACRCE|nr:Huntingtin-interacting protein 1 [Acropora cervicornis]